MNVPATATTVPGSTAKRRARSHQRPRSRPWPPPPSTAPLCPLDQVALVQRSNERGAWRSHWLASEQRYYKGTAA